MISAGLLRMIGAAFLLILWALLDYLNIKDQALVLAIQASLAAVGVYHGIENLQTVPRDPPPSENPPQQIGAPAAPFIQP